MQSRPLRVAVALALIVAAAIFACSPLAHDPFSYGTHDWDEMESFRYLATTSLTRFHELPYWDPFACGGFAAWGSPEGGTTIVSPVAPAYLAFALPIAMRIEIVATLIFGIAGTWLLAARFCRDPIVCAMVAIVGFMNSRWMLQASVGHTWHLYYAYFPWLIWAGFRLESTTDRRQQWTAVFALLIALAIYTGAIYPLPHAVLALAILAIVIGWRTKSWRFARDLAVAMALGVALAAPKLLPVADTLTRFPRFVESREYVDPISYLRTFVSTESDRTTWPFWETEYRYHEYGIYVGVLGLAAILYGLVRTPADVRVRALRVAGLALLALSFGRYSPWEILHRVPLFRSQHVPTRFMYPAVLFLAIVAGAAIEEAFERARFRLDPRRVKYLKHAFVLGCLVCTYRIADEDRRALAGGFGVHPPEGIARNTFTQSLEVPGDLSYGAPTGPASFTVTRANAGALRCNMFHGFSVEEWKLEGHRPALLGAIGSDEPGYHGEIYVDQSAALAHFVDWTPDRMIVDVEGAHDGDLLVLNQNWDPSWRANGMPTENLRGVNAHRLLAGETRIELRYTPRTMPFALMLLAFGFVTAFVSVFRERARCSASASRAKGEASQAPA